jgi:Uma2 family endonuclease
VSCLIHTLRTPDVSKNRCDPRKRGTHKKVLAPDSETIDRGSKRRDYLACLTTEEYVLIDSQAVGSEIYRKEGQKWVYELLRDDDIVQVASPGVQFPLRTAYEDV